MSFANRNEGDDIELKSCIIFAPVATLSPSR